MFEISFQVKTIVLFVRKKMGFYRVTGNNYFDTYQSQSVEKAGLDAPSLSQHSFTFILEQGINVI